jgi:hypothetical protein
MSHMGHELPVETYLWQVRSTPNMSHRYDWVQTMIVRQRWLCARDLNLARRELSCLMSRPSTWWESGGVLVLEGAPRFARRLYVATVTRSRSTRSGMRLSGDS